MRAMPLTVAAMWVAAAIACRNVDQAENAAKYGPTLHLRHGIAIGQVIEGTTFACSDSTDRTVAGRSARQIITLANASDFCSECDRHLTGLDAIAAALSRDADRFLLTYASPARTSEVLNVFKSKTRLPVCFDASGAFWRRYDISHTPVTIVLRDGMVVYAYDGPLDDSIAQLHFARGAAAMLTPP